MNIFIEQGRIIHPVSQLDQVMDLYLSDNKLVGLDQKPKGFHPTHTIHAQNHWVIPGLVDSWCHLKDQDGNLQNHEARVALQKGFTQLFCAPEGYEVTDTVNRVEKILGSNASISISPIGALTENLAHERLTDLTALASAGCQVFSNGLRTSSNLKMQLNAYKYAASFGLKVIIFAMEPSLSHGLIHEGTVSAQTGLKGIPTSAETTALASHLILIEQSGVQAHFSHITSAQGVDMIRKAQQQGLAVTADCTMHHLHLSDEQMLDFNQNAFVYPPLRTSSDRQALRDAVRDGTLCAISSSHQPLSSISKKAPLGEAQPGMSTLDTFLSLGLKLVNEKVLTASQLVERVTCGPASALGVQPQKLEIGSSPDLCVVDPAQQWQVCEQNLLSKGKNSAFLNWKLPGQVKATIKQGSLAYTQID